MKYCKLWLFQQKLPQKCSQLLPFVLLLHQKYPQIRYNSSQLPSQSRAPAPTFPIDPYPHPKIYSPPHLPWKTQTSALQKSETPLLHPVIIYINFAKTHLRIFVGQLVIYGGDHFTRRTPSCGEVHYGFWIGSAKVGDGVSIREGGDGHPPWGLLLQCWRAASKRKVAEVNGRIHGLIEARCSLHRIRLIPTTCL